MTASQSPLMPAGACARAGTAADDARTNAAAAMSFVTGAPLFRPRFYHPPGLHSPRTSRRERRLSISSRCQLHGGVHMRHLHTRHLLVVCCAGAVLFGASPLRRAAATMPDWVSANRQPTPGGGAV